MQRIREAERSLVYEFLERAEDIVTGVINRKEGKISSSIWKKLNLFFRLMNRYHRKISDWADEILYN